MLGRTHAIGGFVAWEATAPLVTHDPLTMAVGAVFAVWGSYGPDMDHAKSTWSHSFPGGALAARIISRAVGGHRMGTHSLLSIPLSGLAMYGILVLASLLQPYDLGMAAVWAFNFAVGWASHIAEDALTVQGVGAFHPLSRKRFRIGNLRTSKDRNNLNFGEAMVGFLLVVTGGFLLINLIGGQLEQAIGHTAVDSSQSSGGGH